MYRVLLPVDDDVERSLAQADYVASLPAEPDSIEVIVAHAYDDTVARRDPTGETLPEAESRAVSETMAALDDDGFAVSSEELYSPVAEAIVETATDIDADGIVVGGRKRSPSGKALFGSVTQAVILDAGRPVTVVIE